MCFLGNTEYFSLESSSGIWVSYKAKLYLVEETVEIQELKTLIKETMREVLREEQLTLCKILVPYVTDAEQADLEAEFGSPADYHEDEKWAVYHPFSKTLICGLSTYT